MYNLSAASHTHPKAVGATAVVEGEGDVEMVTGGGGWEIQFAVCVWSEH